MRAASFLCSSMNISYNWLRDYLHTDFSPEQIGEVLTAIGLEVESIDRVEPVPGGLEGVVVGEVLECAPHPDADRLRITRVNLGEGEPVQIVCGATNVAAGQKVLVATIGTTLYPGGGEPLVIKKSKIRGAESHGMICAEDELGLGTDHGGIMVLDASATPGAKAADVLGLRSDFLLSIGLTPNRTDSFSHIGVARELAAALAHMEGRTPINLNLSLPDVSKVALAKIPSPISVDVKDVEACPRYTGLFIQGLKVGPSPEWLQERLAVIGLRSINTIVDITNYVQHECGQPLHAFDADHIGGGKVIVRRATDQEAFTTLDGTERKLSSEDLVIADANRPMCLAGIFGGLDSGVSESTTSVFLESAWFNASGIRKSARRHGLNTDSSFRFERGTDSSQVMWAALRAAGMITEIAGGVISSETTDLYPTQAVRPEITLRYARVELLIGKKIAPQKIKSILHALGFEISSENDLQLTIHSPFYRVDVTREVDVIEEILRIYGYDHVDYPTAMRSSLSIAPKPDPDKIYERVADVIAATGFTEIMSMSMTRQRYATLTEEPEYSDATAVNLLNPLSSDLGIMRQSLLFGVLQSIALNQNHRNPDLRLFELGKEYRKRDGKFEEKTKLAIAVSGRNLPESWNNSSNAASFVNVKSALEDVFRTCGVRGLQTKGSEFVFFEDGLDWSRGKDCIARAGLISSSILQTFDVRAAVWYAEIDWDLLIRSLPATAIAYKAPEKFPAVRRDLSLLLDRKVRFAEIESCAFSVDRKILREVNLFDVYEGKNLEAGKKSYAVSFVLQDSEKTMTDKQVDGLMERIRTSLFEKLGASLR